MTCQSVCCAIPLTPSRPIAVKQNRGDNISNVDEVGVRCQKCKENFLIPYNGLFSRCQIFAVLSKKHEDYLRILIFAVANVREKSFRFFSAKSIGWVAQLDFSSIEQMCGKKISGQTNREYLQSYVKYNTKISVTLSKSDQSCFN